MNRSTKLAAGWVGVVVVLAAILLTGCWVFDSGEPELVLWAPDAQISAGTTYDIGSVAVGETLTVELSIKNDGSAALHVSSIQISGTGFTIPDHADGFEVGDNGGQQSFVIQFAPVTAGSATASLGIHSDLPGNEVFSVTLTATATEPEPVPEPEPLAPPAWTHGTWRDGSDFNIYTFSVDNVVANLMGTTIDFHQFNVDNLDIGAHYEDTEVTATVYKIEMWSAGAVAQTLTFTQVDSDTLSYQVDAIAPITLEKDL